LGNLAVHGSYKAIDVLPMPRQERPNAGLLFVTPAILVAELGRNLSGGESVKQNRDPVDEFDRIPGYPRCKRVARERDYEHKSEIRLYYRGPPQVPKQQGMPLLELDERVQQIGEEDGKDEDRNDATGTVNNPTDCRDEQNGQHDIQGSAIWEYGPQACPLHTTALRCTEHVVGHCPNGKRPPNLFTRRSNVRRTLVSSVDSLTDDNTL
jgi:hypothetical protein